MSNLVAACPECDGTNTHPRSPRNDAAPRKADPDHRHRCSDCSATFDEHNYRKSKDCPGNLPRSEPGNCGLARVLSEMDPDEFDEIVGGGSA